MSGNILAAPLAAGAQPKVLGYLTPGGCPTGLSPHPDLVPFLDGLKQKGYVVGQNIAIECRFSDQGNEAQLRGFAVELARLNVALIFAESSTAMRAVRSATSTIPVVALDLETDPIGSGLAASLARPGGNTTGIFLDALELNGKWLELLRAVAPRLRRVTALWEATTDPAPLQAAEAAARPLGIQLKAVPIRSPKDLDAAFRTATRERAGAVVVMQSPMLDVHRKRIADLAHQSRLPTIAMFPTFVHDGGLMSYGPDVRDLFRHVTVYIDRILRGARPGDIPIERPTHFYLVVNLKIARALSLTVPPSILARADQVIE